MDTRINEPALAQALAESPPHFFATREGKTKQQPNTMSSSIKKIVAGLGLAALCVAPAIAGQFYISNNQSGTAVVPSAGSCGQVCYSASPYGWETTTGPLGTYTLSGYNGNQGANHEYLVASGPVAPGTYNCSVYASGGWASITITW